ncbi:haloacid dehalogenase-like hydrolase domain-containing protein [Ditylenchus destructor]|nr:haloacid dehalogenase-like hydrolase domain-containing protein [Ditylenchus destructor]
MLIDMEPRKKFKAVLFDMGGVLIRYKDPSAYDRLMLASLNNREIAKGLQNFDNGILSVSELKHLLREVIPGLPENVDDIENAKVENHAILNHDILRIVTTLRQYGLKAAIVTNNGYWTPKKKRTVLISDTSNFDLVIESCKLGMRKPNQEIYRFAANQLRLKPQECIFVDDMELNCRGAADAGMTPIFVELKEKLCDRALDPFYNDFICINAFIN